MDFQQWCRLDELLYISQTDEQYKQYAGLEYDERIISRLAEMKLENSKMFIDFFHDREEALFLGAVEDIAYSRTKTLELEIHNLRNTQIVSSKQTFNDSPVNWSNWRQFNSHTKVAENRREVFDEFINKTGVISPIIEKRFSLINQTYLEYASKQQSSFIGALSPNSGYLASESMTQDALLNFLKSLGEKAKAPFARALEDTSRDILNRDPEYYDDFYFFRNRVYSDIERPFASIDPIVEVKRLVNSLNFDVSNIHFDIENRKKKYPSPICFFVEVPSDIRILYKSESPYFDFQGCFHETGHAIHATSVDKNSSYSDKYRIPMGVAEIFSIFLERLTHNRSYLSYLRSKGKLDIEIDKIIAKNNFMELFFIVFYIANSLMKFEYWEKNLTIDKASEIYSKLLREYTGLDVPGEYWLLHHILPEAIMYVPSYLIAAVRAYELENYIRNKFGDLWWNDKQAGEELKQIMKPGAKLDLAIFSKLETRSFMEELVP